METEDPATSNSETETSPKKPIWAYALLATAIAVIWSLASVTRNVTAEDYITELPDGIPAAGGIIGYAMATALLASLLTWGAFYLILFRRRASLNRALVVLAIMFSASFVLSIPARALAAVYARGSEIIAIRSHFANQVQRAQADTLARMRALELDAPLLEGIRTVEDIDNKLQRNAQALSILNDFERSIAAEYNSLVVSLAALPMTAGERTEMREEFTHVTSPNSTANRAFGLRRRLLEQEAEILLFLKLNEATWTSQEGTVTFHSNETLDRFNALATEYDSIVRELEALRLSAASTPTYSAPPPRQ